MLQLIYSKQLVYVLKSQAAVNREFEINSKKHFIQFYKNYSISAWALLLVFRGKEVLQKNVA